MGQPHCRVRGIYALSPVSGSPEHVPVYILWIDDHIHLFSLRHDRYCSRGGMYPSSGFGLRYPLYSVDPGFIFEPGKGSPSIYHEGDLLETSKSVFIEGHKLRLPVIAGSKISVHPVKVRSKQC